MNSAAGVSSERIVMGAQIITGVSAVDPGLRSRERIVKRLNQGNVRPQHAGAAAENQLRALLVTRLQAERDRHRIRTDVRQHLPQATPSVSPAARRQQLDQRRRQVGRRFNV